MVQIDQLKTDQLKTFRCVVENQTFSAAARTLFLSQPAVTLQIKRLEKTIGMPLFVRVRPTISLTPVGEVVYRYSVNIAKELLFLKNELSILTQPERERPLVIGAGTIFGSYMLPRFLKSLKARLPSTPLSVKIDHNVDVLLDEIRKQTADFGIFLGGAIPPEFAVQPLFDCPLSIALHPESKLAGKDVIRERELSKFHWIIPSEKHSRMRMIIDHWQEQQELNFDIAYEVADCEAIKQLVRAGLGEGLLYWPVIADSVKRGEIVSRSLDSPPVGKMCLVYHQNTFDSFRLKALNAIQNSFFESAFLDP
jgi:DNA-binding transcriptional LysR family regulator